MKKKVLYALWGGMFILCAALGFIPEPAGAVRGLLLVLSLLFFLPPVLLICQAGREKDGAALKLIRNLSALSLGLTLVLMVLNILCAAGSEVLGSILNSVLVIVSSPMICSGQWALSLFLWACLLMGSLSLIRKTK